MGNKADNGKTECNKIKHGEAKDEKKVPKLRFPGFSGEWKERKLGEVAERYDNLRVPVSANLRIQAIHPIMEQMEYRIMLRDLHTMANLFLLQRTVRTI
ncbi:MAG: hypothetical protein ACLTK0_00165 [Anaerovoracaceae bacterium]